MDNTCQTPISMDIIAENKRRIDNQRALDAYNPSTGFLAVGPRTEVTTPVPGLPKANVPNSMLDDPEYNLVRNNAHAWTMLRFKHDFEFWAEKCVNIFYKDVGKKGPLILNPGQRKVLNELENQRRAGNPVRVIILKARQWGATTLISSYMAWLQLILNTNCNSIFCGHNKDAAINIRGMLEHLMAEYPVDYWDTDISTRPELRPFAGSPNIREIRGRDCRVTLATAETPDAVRGANIALAHLTEVAYYPNSSQHSPENLMKAIIGSVANAAGTAVVMESTANGVGNFFHREWERASAGESDKTAIFIPWAMIPQYSHSIDSIDPQEFFDSFDKYEQHLWFNHNLTLEQIKWHRDTLRSYPSAESFHAEYPIDASEAFALSGNAVFHPDKIRDLAASVTEPDAIGEMVSPSKFSPDPKGNLRIWEQPEKDEQYVAAMDIGGRSERADWSVISVLAAGPNPRVVAQWRGHIDHDILADKAMEIGQFYNKALLVVESNSVESGDDRAIVDYSLPVLEKLRPYRNIYRRRNIDTLSGSFSDRLGFHTNRRTKQLLITELIRAVRDGTYTERDAMACQEMSTYIQLPNGNYAARDGCHDDILMTRALALYAMPSVRKPLNPAEIP